MSRYIGFGMVSFAAMAAAAVVGVSATASAATMNYDFSHNIAGSPGSETGASFGLAVTEINPFRASFTFTNSGMAGSAITGIHFYDGVVLANSSPTVTGNTGGTAGTNWVPNEGTPENLPGITDYFGQGGGQNFPATLEFFSATQGMGDAIHVGDDLTITVDLAVSFATMIQMLEDGFGIGSGFNSSEHFVIGIQVQGLEDGGSAQYVGSGGSSTVVIPLPAPVWMGLIGLIGVAAARRRLR